MTDATITDADIMAEIQTALEQQDGDEPGTITRPELERQFGVGTKRANKLLRQLVDDGRLDYAMVKRISGWGDRMTIRGYRYLAH